MARSSAWDEVAHRGRELRSVPALDEIVLPRSALVRRALSEPLHWLVGPPKIGKTVIAHAIAFLDTLASHDLPLRERVLVHEGPGACARGLERLLTGPPTTAATIVLEDPLGRGEPLDPAARSDFVRLLAEVHSHHPDGRLVLTSRHGPYVAAQRDLRDAGLDHPSEMTISDWYDPTDLFARYSSSVPRLTPDLAERLGCPALIHQLRDHGVVPDPSARLATRQRFGDPSNEITLDKLSLLEDDDDLTILAMLLRLQEHAFVLPTADDIDVLLDTPFAGIDHAGLVATTFVFDGEPRLRFEHSTTREAADLLLARETSDDLPLLRRILDQGVRSWPNRALELWKAERAAAEGDWEAVAATDGSTRLAVAAQLVEHSRGEDPGIGLVADLDLDPWAAQDVGYALANTWHREMPAPARRLANQLVDDYFGRGAYALLEALLYVLGDQTSELWAKVDHAYARRADDETWTGDQLKELLLAVDALAWRPPPSWHTPGTWTARFLDSLRPTDDGWALVRFLRGYHPEGLAYLIELCPKLAQDVIADRGTEWTDAQAQLGSWLVQWHFVHQCRARAQLAHQPWVDSVYLTRTFHECDVDLDRDRELAELVDSVAGAPSSHAGWGYFLAENLRAIAPQSVGQETRTAARRSLERAGPRDVGVLAAVLTYQPEGTLAPLVKKHFDDADAERALVDALAIGLIVDDVRLTEPRFSHRRSLAAIYDSSGFSCGEIESVLGSDTPYDDEGRFDVEAFARAFEDAASDAELDLLQQAQLSKVLDRVRGGDVLVVNGASRRSRRRLQGLSLKARYELLVVSTCESLAEG